MVLDRSYESESSPPTKLDKNCENVIAVQETQFSMSQEETERYV